MTARYQRSAARGGGVQQSGQVIEQMMIPVPPPSYLKSLRHSHLVTIRLMIGGELSFPIWIFLNLASADNVCLHIHLVGAVSVDAFLPPIALSGLFPRLKRRRLLPLYPKSYSLTPNNFLKVVLWMQDVDSLVPTSGELCRVESMVNHILGVPKKLCTRTQDSILSFIFIACALIKCNKNISFQEYRVTCWLR